MRVARTSLVRPERADALQRLFGCEIEVVVAVHSDESYVVEQARALGVSAIALDILITPTIIERLLAELPNLPVLRPLRHSIRDARGETSERFEQYGRASADGSLQALADGALRPHEP